MIAGSKVYGFAGPAFVIAITGLVSACGDIPHARGAPTPAVRRQLLEETDDTMREAVFACEEDSDCIAVPQAGLCRNGVKEAVNRHHMDAYQETRANVRHGPCTFLLIRDRRVARCDQDAGRCVLVILPQTPKLPAVFSPESDVDGRDER